MQHYEDEVADLETRLAPRRGGAPLAFYGSSTFRLWSALERTFADLGACNCAFGGSTLEACAHFYPRIVPPLAPRGLILYAGDNDIGDGRSAAATIASLSALVAAHDHALPRCPLWFVGIKASLARWERRDRIEAVNAAAAAVCLARARDGWRYLDLFTPMLGRDGRPRPELLEADGLHLSAAGYGLWTERIGPELRATFSPNCHASPPRTG